MENTIYNIILADGTEIQATINGNNFITDNEVDNTVLSDENLKSVNIGGVDYSDMTCTNVWEEDGHTRFIIRELTVFEKSEKELKEKIKEIEEMFGIMLTGEVK